MIIRPISKEDFDDMISCLLKAFEGYFVKLPSDKNYWKKRFRAARIQWPLSFAAFDEGKMIGFIITGVDIHNGLKTAFNSGTGVIKEYRGQKIVDRIYDCAFPYFKESGIKKCMLEVITENHRAIRVYERIGFKIDRELKCYSGTLEKPEDVTITKISFDSIVSRLKDPGIYSWDNMDEAIRIAEPECYLVTDKNNRQGYFAIDPQTGYVFQIETDHIDYKNLLRTIGHISPIIKINNIDSSRIQLIYDLEHLGIANTLNQWEMSMLI